MDFNLIGEVFLFCFAAMVCMATLSSVICPPSERNPVPAAIILPIVILVLYTNVPALLLMLAVLIGWALLLWNFNYKVRNFYQGKVLKTFTEVKHSGRNHFNYYYVHLETQDRNIVLEVSAEQFYRIEEGLIYEFNTDNTPYLLEGKHISRTPKVFSFEYVPEIETPVLPPAK